MTIAMIQLKPFKRPLSNLMEIELCRNVLQVCQSIDFIALNKVDCLQLF